MEHHDRVGVCGPLVHVVDPQRAAVEVGDLEVVGLEGVVAELLEASVGGAEGFQGLDLLGCGARSTARSSQSLMRSFSWC